MLIFIYLFILFLAKKEDMNLFIKSIYEYVKRIDGRLDKIEEQLKNQGYFTLQQKTLNN